MEFNQSFLAYDTIDGANCQTVYPAKMTRREAVKVIGLRQIREPNMCLCGDIQQEADMFVRRLDELKRYC